MRYVTTIERRAIERGHEQGRRQNAFEAVVEALTVRFDSIPPELLAALNQISDVKRLKELLREAILAGSLEEFEHAVETGVQH